MEKVSRYYLTPDVKHRIYRLPWLPELDTNARHVKEAALVYAEKRKGILTELADMDQEHGLIISLRRFQFILNLKIHGFSNKVMAWGTGNIDSIFKVDSLVSSDVSKVGAH